MKVESYKEQKYDKLRKHHQELGVPWTDPTFPANDSSIGLSKVRELRGIEWRRVPDIAHSPSLVKEGVGRHDVVQGRLGNCWFVAAASVLAGEERLWENVVPDYQDQEWDQEDLQKYCGIFRFRFWRFGRWLEVLVDDYIPTRDGVPLFTYSKNSDEFWSALLEKAYAKLHGSYEALDGGNLSDALVDFTGGVAEMIKIREDHGEHNFKSEEEKQELFNKVSREIEEHALICCAIRASGGRQEERTECGLVKGHAYSLTGIKKVPVGSIGISNLFKGREKVPLVRLRNPWGNKEWNGAFSDGSREWKAITIKEKEKLGLVTKDDGEFWMPWDDFMDQFTDLSLNHLINTSLFSFSKTWKEIVQIGKWTKPFLAGGCLNNTETFLRNPQYSFDVEAKHGEEEEVIFQLSQKDEGANVIERSKFVIGTHVLEVEANRVYRIHKQLSDGQLLSSDFIKSRHVFFRAKLKPGRYVVIPTTFNPGEEGDFLLRVFGDKLSTMTELTQDEPDNPACFSCGCGTAPQVVSRVTVLSADGLPKKGMGKSDPYVLIKCEGETVRSVAVPNTLAPSWNFPAIFYRKKIEKGIKVQVWDYNRVIMDTFLGQGIVKDKMANINTKNPFGDESGARSVQVLDLYNKGRKKEDKMEGSVKVIIESSRDLSAF